MTGFMKRSLMFMLTLVLLLTFIPLTSVAAASKSPYAEITKSASSDKIVYEFNEYDSKHGDYDISKKVSSKGNYIYNSRGDLIFAESNGSSTKYVGFDENGTLLVISSDGSVYGSENLKVFQLLLKGKNAISFKYTDDDLITSVKTKKGTFSVSNFELVEEAKEESDNESNLIVSKENSRIEKTLNSDGSVVYKAYKNELLYMTLTVDGSDIVNNSSDIALSPVSIDAKFLGIDTSYNVYLYESNGTLYRFKHGSWYSAQKLNLSGNFKRYTADDNGFLSKIYTSKKTYTIEQLLPDSSWVSDRTYAVNEDNYSILYIKDSATTNTLTISDRVLQLNGKTVAKNVDNFYFSSAETFVYTKGRNLYEATIEEPDDSDKISTKFKKFTFKNGLAVKATLRNGKTISLK